MSDVDLAGGLMSPSSRESPHFSWTLAPKSGGKISTGAREIPHKSYPNSAFKADLEVNVVDSLSVLFLSLRSTGTNVRISAFWTALRAVQVESRVRQPWVES